MSTIHSSLDICYNIESFLFSAEWKAAVLLMCDPNQKKGIFKVRRAERTDDFVSEDRTNSV